MLEVEVGFKSTALSNKRIGGQMKIGQLARATGLRPSAIRYYERLGLPPRPDRANGQRRYPGNAHNRVLLIRFASAMGFTLSEIKLFLNGLRDAAPVGSRWRKLAKRKIKEVDISIKRARCLKSLLEYLLQCRCASLQVCVQRLTLSPSLRSIGQSKRSSHISRTRAAGTN
jgi:MerR family transcriptional regulator, redox-sensitive transcriptional activator SoxR